MAGKAAVFEPAIAAMQASGQQRLEPTSFRDYLAAHNLSVRGKTPEYISIDRLADLPSNLRAAQTMVFRLGTGLGNKARFSLVRVGEVEDFFLNPTACGDPETFLSPASMQQLFGFSLVQATETTLVNLALAAGVFSHALELDEAISLAAAATGNTVETFSFRPHPANPEPLEHVSGQVQIDAVFVEKRGGRDTCFVLETKGKPGGIAKHKLAYPVMALAQRLPLDIPIVPIYMEAVADPKGHDFLITECEMPDPRLGEGYLSDLTEVRTRHLRLPLVPA